MAALAGRLSKAHPAVQQDSYHPGKPLARPNLE